MSEELCDGVKMLIERMQTNPEDFEFEGRLYGYRNLMEEALSRPPADHSAWFLSNVEKQALIDAYRDMHRTKFTAGVVQSIFSPEPQYDINMDRPYKIPSTILAPKNMLKQATEILNKEFDKEYVKNYAKSSRTRP